MRPDPARAGSFPGWPELLEQYGVLPEVGRGSAPTVALFGFEPGDIVSEVMSFGSPTPIEVIVASPNLADARQACQSNQGRDDKRFHGCATCSSTRLLDYPVRRGRYRPREGRTLGRHRRAGRQRRHRRHVLQPVHRAQLLARTRKPASTTRSRSSCPTQRMTTSEQVATLPIEQVTNSST